MLPYNQGHETIVSGMPYVPFQPLQGLPGGMLSQIAAAPLMSSFGAAGVPLGYAGYPGQTNLYNNVRMQMFTDAHQQMMQQAVMQDAGRMVEYARTMAHSVGRPFGDEQEKAIRNSVAAIAPFAAVLSPATMDMFAGGRSHFALSNNIHLSGRYRSDPVTGFGMSAASSNHIAQGIFENYYSDPSLGLTRAAGLSANEIGSLFGELTRRGLMMGPGSRGERVVSGLNFLSPGEQESALRSAGIDIGSLGRLSDGSYNLGKLDDDKLRKLESVSSVQFGMRSADAGRIVHTLDKYKKAVAAVKEIFGDAGRPNAPFNELWNMLETLTAGSMQQMDPGRIEMTVRNIRNSANRAGITMEGVSRMMTMAGSDLQAMGLNPVFMTQVVPGSMNWREAYNQIGGGFAPGWGLRSGDQLMLMDQQRRTRAIGSSLGNRLGALARLQARGIEFSGDAADLLRQMQNGSIDDRFIRMGSTEFNEMLANNSSLSVSQVERAMQHRSLNEEFIFTNNLGSVVTAAQKREFLDRILGGERGGAFNTIATMHLREINGKADNGLALDISRSIAESIGGMSNEVRRNKDVRNSLAARELRKKLESTEAGRAHLRALEEKGDVNEQLKFLVEESYGHAETVARERYGIDYLENPLSLMDPKVTQKAAQNKKSTELTSLLQSIHSGDFDPNALNRLFKTLSSGDTDLAKLMGSALGLDTKHAVHLAGSLSALHRRSAAIEAERQKLIKKVDAGTATDEEIRKLKSLTDESGALQEGFQQIQSYLDRPDVRKALGDHVRNTLGGGAGDSGGPSEWTMNGVTINVNGKVVLTDGSGDGGVGRTPTGRGAPTPAGGV